MDELPHLKPALLDIITEEKLRIASSPDTPSSARLFRCTGGQEKVIVATGCILDAYLSRCRDLAQITGRPDGLLHLRSALLSMYNAEIDSLTTTLDVPYSNAVSEVLMKKSALPGMGIVLPIAIANNATKEEIKEIEGPMIKFGEIFWILDGVVDSLEDLQRGFWGYPWILMAQEGWTPPKGEGRIKRAINDLFSGDTIEKCIEDLADRYEEVSIFFKDRGVDQKKIDETLLPWFAGWFGLLN